MRNRAQCNHATRRSQGFVPILAFLILSLGGCAGPGELSQDYARQANDLRTPIRQPRPLTQREYVLARAAWRYFTVNANPQTGFSHTTADQQTSSLVDIAATLNATVAAMELRVLNYADGRDRLERVLRSLGDVDLFAGAWPYANYHPATLTPQLPAPGRDEPVVSVAGTARLLAALAFVRQRVAPLATEVDSVVLRWSFCDLLSEDGQLRSGYLTAGGQLVWRDNLGWAERQYAAAAFALWGFDVTAAMGGRPPAEYPVEGLGIPVDRLDNLSAAAVTDPWVRMYVEFGWDRPDRPVSSRDVFTAGRFADYADRIYRVQESRHSRRDILTARSPHRMRRDPFRVIDTIVANGEAWATVTRDGDPADRYALTSARAAAGMWATWDTDYTTDLIASLAFLQTPDAGLYEGLWEGQPKPSPVLTAETNGFVLQALLTGVDGPLLNPTLRQGVWQRALSTPDSLCRAVRQRSTP